MNVIIGLTGPTGSGKSSVATLCSELGLTHIDCDILAREAVKKGSKGLAAVVNVFGNEILNADGTLNRTALAGLAFSTPEKTELLNSTIFPYIRELVLAKTGKGKILLDAPTLFESGINDICLKTVAVLSNTDLRKQRIMLRDSLTEQQALLRINAGKNDEFYLNRADYIIYNNKTEADFLQQIKSILNQILEKGENI